MTDLVLDSLEVRGFRAFQHLRIQDLGRVNLIVGKNNVGKSSLLEALQIYTNKAHPQLIWQILGAHDEMQQTNGRSFSHEEMLLSVKYLFYGRKGIEIPSKSIQIGPFNSPANTLSLTIRHYFSKLDKEGRRSLHPMRLEENIAEQLEDETIDDIVPRISVKMGRQSSISYPLKPNPYSRALRSELKEINCIFIESNGLDKKAVGELWDKIALTDREVEVLAALRIIAPGVQDISIVGDPSSLRERFTIVKVMDIDEPVPIRSLGDGMQRMLGIALALANAKNGMLLIDEIENGLHYSVQTDLWHFIFRIAQQLNVQVFATSHSWDCISSFQKAAQENEQEDGVLIRLENKKGTVNAVVFNKQKLGIATREQIEVR